MTKATQNLIAIVASGRDADAGLPLSNLHRLRNDVTVSEDEDARLTGMTKSLDRRLLALNLQPIAPASAPRFMKVA